MNLNVFIMIENKYETVFVMNICHFFKKIAFGKMNLRTKFILLKRIIHYFPITFK